MPRPKITIAKRTPIKARPLGLVFKSFVRKKYAARRTIMPIPYESMMIAKIGGILIMKISIREKFLNFAPISSKVPAMTFEDFSRYSYIAGN
jgi:hypothetical protein